MKLLCHSVFLFLFIIQVANVVLADIQGSKLDPYFYISRDAPELGGCTDEQVEWLRKAYDEAIKMIRGAIDAIDFLKRGRDFYNKDKQHQWNKAAVELIQMFGISVHPFGHVMDPRKSSQLDRARGNVICFS